LQEKLYQNSSFTSRTMTVQKIQFGDEGEAATRALAKRYAATAGEPLAGYLRTFEGIDRKHGGSGPLPLEDAPEVADAAIEAAHAQGEDDLVIGIALWAMRHEVALRAIDPVVNALARRSNDARGGQELAAVFGLMQGFIAHVAPSLAADLERSNPERPWRVLHANFAITAIRSEEPPLMAYAFDALDAALPGERAGFYSEAMALALAPRIAPAVREAIAERHRRWTQG
jgi:hypothetical protein